MRKYTKDMTRNEIISRLKSGDKLVCDGGAEIEIIDGFICANSSNGYETINYQLSLNDGIDWYFELPLKTIDVKVGNIYRTRAGEKAFVYSVNKEGDFLVAIEGGICYNILSTGYYSEEKETDKDLVSLWDEKTEEEPKEETDMNFSDIKNEKEKRVVELLNQNMLQKDVSKKLGVSPSLISRIARKNGIRCYTRHKKLHGTIMSLNNF